MERTSDEGTIRQPYSSPAAARLRLSNRPTPTRILAVAEYGYSLRFSEPPLGVEWCRVAAEACTDAFASSLRSRVLGYFGNSLRVVGNYEGAREAIERALKISPGDPLLLEFKGSLLRDVRDLDEAGECLDAAARKRKVAGDIGGYARTILITAQVMDLTGQSRRAASYCLEAVDVLNGLVDPTHYLLRTAIQNYATFLCNAGKAMDALQVLRTSKPFLEGGEPFFQLRVEWLYGRISSVLREESAEPKLLSVRQKLAEGGLFQEAALATLDLAKYFVRKNDPRGASTALSVAPYLQSIGIERDAREAVLLSQIATAETEGSNIEFLISDLYAEIALRPAARRIA